jgi:hypothetical protein
MVEFKEWLANTVGTENVDSKIDALYNKAKYAVKLVQLYDRKTNQKLLTNISTIADLNRAGVYGLYNSSENKDVIGPKTAARTKFMFGQRTYDQYKGNLRNLPPAVINQYKPNVDPSQLAPSDVIHVNVRAIVSRLGDTKEAIIEIASTIVHECTHQMEFREKGKTTEVGPEQAEKAFKVWADPAGPNWKMIIAAIPQLNF